MSIFKKHTPGLIFAIWLLAMGLVSCQGRTTPLADAPTLSPSPTMTSTLTLQRTPSPAEAIVIPTHPPEAPGLPDALIKERAQEALANLVGISSEEIEVIGVEEVEWRDTSLGCPQPGMVYAQVIVPGWRVVMGVDDDAYEYRSGEGHGVLCDQQGHLTSIVPSPTVTSVAVPSAPTPTIEDVCPMMPVFPHGRVCPTPWAPHD